MQTYLKIMLNCNLMLQSNHLHAHLCILNKSGVCLFVGSFCCLSTDHVFLTHTDDGISEMVKYVLLFVGSKKDSNAVFHWRCRWNTDKVGTISVELFHIQVIYSHTVFISECVCM